MTQFAIAGVQLAASTSDNVEAPFSQIAVPCAMLFLAMLSRLRG